MYIGTITWIRVPYVKSTVNATVSLVALSAVIVALLFNAGCQSNIQQNTGQSSKTVTTASLQIFQLCSRQIYHSEDRCLQPILSFSNFYIAQSLCEGVLDAI